MAREGGKDRGLFQRPKDSGIWWIRYNDAWGQERREKAGTKAQAKMLYQKRQAEKLQGVKLPELNRRQHQATVADAISRYLPQLKVDKPGSYQDDVRYAGYWTQELGGLTLEEVRPKDIEQYKARRLQQVKPATVNRAVAFLKHLFFLAIRDGLTERNPVTQVAMLQENNTRIRYMLSEEESGLRQALEPDGWLKVELAMLTGLRQGEQFGPRGLSWVNVDFGAGKQGVLTVPRSKHGEARHVPLSPRGREILLQLRGESKGPWVFAGREPGLPYYPSSAYHLLARACQRAGIVNFRWHDLRHTFCSRLVMKGVPLRTVQLLAGHKTISVTERYAHLAPSHLQDAVALLDSPGPKTTNEVRAL